jgi:F-type H+-transporting ATPase subunit delta
VLKELNLSLPTANFINLLVDKQRIGIINEIEKDYLKLMDNALGIARVQVRTAFPFTTELSANLKHGLESFTGKHVDMQVEEDASLLGGIVVRVGDKLYDGSIKMQLNNIMKLLGEET